MVDSNAEIRIHADSGAVARSAAQILAGLASEAAATGRRLSVVLSGGSTPKPLFQVLASARSPVTDWSPIDLFWGDERCVGPEDPDSNYGMARRLLLDRLDLASSQVHRIRGELSPDEAAERYCSELRSHFGITGRRKMPRFDLVFLGLGGDGHTASLFPGSTALTERRRPVVATRVEKLDSDRITLTLPAINNARCVVFLVTGASKAEVLKRVSTPGDPGLQLPAALVRPRGRLIFLTDRRAAGLLKEGRDE